MSPGACLGSRWRCTATFSAPSCCGCAPSRSAHCLGLAANGHGRDIDIDPQQALGEPMVRRLAIALEVIPRYPVELGNGLGRTGLQGAGNGRLLRTARAPKGPLHGWVDANCDMTLRNRLGPTQHAQHAMEQFVRGAIADRFLWN